MALCVVSIRETKTKELFSFKLIKSFSIRRFIYICITCVYTGARDVDKSAFARATLTYYRIRTLLITRAREVHIHARRRPKYCTICIRYTRGARSGTKSVARRRALVMLSEDRDQDPKTPGAWRARYALPPVEREREREKKVKRFRHFCCGAVRPRDVRVHVPAT